MRLKYVKGARELIENNPELIIDNQDNKRIDIKGLFEKEQPIHIEIGMGKGQFVYTLAKQNPGVNFVGIERFDSAIVKALYKVLDEPLSNLYLLRTDASDLRELFDDKTIARIYLNFSDPWPKDRHAKRRLTNERFLRIYEDLLIQDGEVHFKTDNYDLFEYSLGSIQKYGMDITYINYDLHNSDVRDNIMTEFEEKFSKQGMKINKLIAKFKEDNNE